MELAVVSSQEEEFVPVSQLNSIREIIESMNKFNQIEVVLSSESFFPSLNVISTHDITSFYTYNDEFSSNYLGSIFHPPGA
jgi:hypothetical protein